MSKRPVRRTPWRERIEALTMAIIVALVLKCFVIEVSQIPSGSMQPTLMGDDVTQVFDRVLVDKLSFAFRDPERFEVVVFRHPLERSRNMVKRVVGLPSEHLKIENGDLWTRPDEASPWSVVRRPRSVEEETWKRIAPRSQAVSDWRIADGSRGWSLEGGVVRARGDGAVRFRPGDASILNEYLDGYPDAMRAALAPTLDARRSARERVGDLRVDAQVEAGADCREVVLELTEGARRYRFRIPGPAAGDDESPSIALEGAPPPSTGDAPRADVRHQTPLRLRAGRASDVRVQNLDDRLELCLDGEWLLSLDVAAVGLQQSSIAIHVAGSAELSDLKVYRDLHYVPGSLVGELRIPAGHYVVLGDNTLDSADSREWRVLTLRPSGGGDEPELRGNFRPSENPRMNGGHQFFRDVWGERRVLAANDSGSHEAAPFVPRELVLGRSVAVFWPLKPADRIWRLGWIH